MLKLLIVVGITILIVAAIVNSASTQPILTTAITPVVINQITHKTKPKEYSLEHTRVVYVYGVIDNYSATLVTKALLELGQDSRPITILINSPGGSVISGAQIISAMEAAKGPVNTLCVELCASMAAMIHSYGSNRLMLNRSIVMYHPASGGLEGEVDKMWSRINMLKTYVDKLDQNVANRAHMKLNDFRQLYEVELWLDAEDAVQRGFADRVVFVRGPGANKLYPPMMAQDKITFVPSTSQPNKKPPFELDWF